MAIFKTLQLSLLALALMSSAVLARTVSEEEQKQLDLTVASYQNALMEKNGEQMLLMFPPEVLNKLAEQANLVPEQMQKLLANQLKHISTNFTIDELNIDAQAKQAGQLPNGDPYYIVPMSLIVTNAKNEKIKITSQLVALLQQDKWYLIRGDNEDLLKVLEVVYPGFSDIQLQKPNFEMLQ